MRQWEGTGARQQVRSQTDKYNIHIFHTAQPSHKRSRVPRTRLGLGHACPQLSHHALQSCRARGPCGEQLREVYISAGVAARSKLPDSTVKSIVSSAQAQLDSKDFEAAILTVVNGVKSEFEDMDSTVLAIIIAACVLGLLTVVLVSVLVCLKLRSMKEDPKPTFFRPDKTRESHKSLAKSETHYDPNTDNVYVSLREPKTAEAVV
uniref:Uncharacterized protein n=1 Tax=Branchiostoma floridae TaxID=7739 RepID=C3XPT2_BRAFL|eukprot:XP_002613944.1 hypothetical protein BRAFLDRAFT_67493 [Branchiostoma floridae]